MQRVFRLLIAWLLGTFLGLGMPMLIIFMAYDGAIITSIIISVGLYFILFEKKKSSWQPVKTLSLLSIVWVVIIQGFGILTRTLEQRLVALTPEAGPEMGAGASMMSIMHTPGIIALLIIGVMPLVCGLILAFILSKAIPKAPTEQKVESKPEEKSVSNNTV